MTQPERPTVPPRMPPEWPDAYDPVGGAGPVAPTPDTHTEGVDAPQGRAVRSSRAGGVWVGLIVTMVVLVLLLVFVLQNSQAVQVDYFGLSGRLPLAVAILLGVVAGALLVAIPGTVRILQLRHNIRRPR